MKRLYLTLALCALMLALLPVAPALAVTPSAPFLAHLAYMFAHASVLHWIVNAWTLLVLHNTFRWYRCLAAYLLAVGASFVPCVMSRPSLGASVFSCFFLGLITPHLWHSGKRSSVLMMAALLLLGFFLPGIAAGLHVALYLCGILFIRLERLARSLIELFSTPR